MVDFRLINGQIHLEYEECIDDRFELEFSNSRASIDEWLSLAKAKGETDDSDPFTIKILVELHKKIDELTNYIKNNRPDRLELKYKGHTIKIGFDGFRIDKPNLKEGKKYYARISMPLFIKRDILVFFEALDKDTAIIKRISRSDEKDWSSYIAESDRLEIRKQKKQ